MACKICGNNRISLIGRPKLNPKVESILSRVDYVIVMCDDCQFYFIQPEPSLSEEDWKKLYGEQYFPEMTEWWKRKRALDRQQRLDALQRYANYPIKSFLDIGCGEGYVLKDAVNRSWSVYGLDIVDNRIAEPWSKQISFFCGNLFNASYPAGFFDAVYVDSVLEHVLEPLKFLKEVSRILKINGVAYFGVPNEDSLYNDFRRFLYYIIGKGDISSRLWPFLNPYHVIGFTKYSLRQTFAEAELTVQFFRCFAGTDEWRKYNFFSKGWLINFCALPIHYLALLLDRSIYLEAIVRKSI